MAVDLGKFVSGVKREISFEDLAGKTIAVDAYNTIYQFLSIIRQPDGTPLMDTEGRVTSHLSGLFYRTTNLIEYRITPVFVFDGIPPVLKQKTLEARASRRVAATKEWEDAKSKGMLEEARIHAVASTKINKEIVASAKQLLDLMGVAYIQAPSEGEAQAARMVRDGIVYASASQDYDSFLFGADVVIRNFTLTGKRRIPRRNVTIDVKLERILLKDLLESLGIDRRQLIWLGMLMGTDFDSGIDGVGPKTALKIARASKTLGEVVGYVKEKYNAEFDTDPLEVERLFEDPEADGIGIQEFNRLIKGKRPDRGGIIEFMCNEHGFSRERIEKYADRLAAADSGKGQKGIGGWL